jgi:hypothetical protein
MVQLATNEAFIHERGSSMLTPYNLDVELAKRALKAAAEVVGLNNLDATNAMINFGVSGRQPGHIVVEVDPGPGYWPLFVPLFADPDGKLYVPEPYLDVLQYWGEDFERTREEIEMLYDIDLEQNDSGRGYQGRGRGNDYDRGRGDDRRGGQQQRDQSRSGGGRGGRKDRDSGGRGGRGRDRDSGLDRQL